MLLIGEPSTAWWNTPSEERRQYQRQYDAQPKARAAKSARQKKYYYRHREERLDAQRTVNYGILRGTYNTMWIEQNGQCAICRKPEMGRYRGRAKALAVDHDPGTGRMRALLCQGCNKGIGSFRHEPNRLRAAVAYLRSHSTS